MLDIDRIHTYTCTCVLTTPDRMAAIESDKCEMPNAFARLSRVMLVAVLQYSTVRTLLRKDILPRCPVGVGVDGGWYSQVDGWRREKHRGERNNATPYTPLDTLSSSLSKYQYQLRPTNNNVSDSNSNSNNYHPAPLP